MIYHESMIYFLTTIHIYFDPILEINEITCSSSSYMFSLQLMLIVGYTCLMETNSSREHCELVRMAIPIDHASLNVYIMYVIIWL